MNEKEQLKADLNKAADLIDEKGHAKFTLQDDRGICLLQSLWLATGNEGNADYWHSVDGGAKETRFGRAALALEKAEGVKSICGFNNDHSADEVKAKLREVANSIDTTAA